MEAAINNRYDFIYLMYKMVIQTEIRMPETYQELIRKQVKVWFLTYA